MPRPRMQFWDHFATEFRRVSQYPAVCLHLLVPSSQATYALLLERMAADRMAVEQMMSRVKATASKTAARIGRTFGWRFGPSLYKDLYARTCV